MLHGLKHVNGFGVIVICGLLFGMLHGSLASFMQTYNKLN